MADIIGRGVIEVSADATKLKAGIEEAKRSIAGLGVATANVTKSSSASIDKYVRSMAVQSTTIGKTADQAKLMELGLRGATEAQLAGASAAMKSIASQKESLRTIEQLKSGMLAFGAVAVTGLIATAIAFDTLVKKAGDFQDMGEKIGDTGENIASLAVSAAVGGASMETVVAASAKLTKGLTGVDDESKAAGAAIASLGLNIADFKAMSPADQLETIAKAMAGFGDGTEKTAVAIALFGRAGAEMLPFLKELGQEGGRQTILTSEQIRLADEYADSQAKLHAQIGLYAGAIASDMVPSYNNLTGAFLDMIKAIGGVEAGTKGLKNSSDIQDFADTGVRAMAFLIDSFDGIARLASVTMSAIGGTLAAIGLAQRLEFKQAKDVLAIMDKQIKDTLARPTMGRMLEQRIAERKHATAEGFGFTKRPEDSKPKINFQGAKADTSKADAATAAAEAKSQLAYDLDQIKKGSEVATGIYANAEKIMQAQRAAGLIDDADYYAVKKTYLDLNNAEQDAALVDQIDRLRQEKLHGKDKIDNARAILDAEAKLAKVRRDASVNVQINSLQDDAAIKKVARAYFDANEAAQTYVATINKQYAREIAGVGMGTKYRADQGGLNAIEDKFTKQKQSLARDERNNVITADQYAKYVAIAQNAYDQEVVAYTNRTTTLTALQEDWTNGATEALRNYYNESKNIAKQTEDLFSGAFKGMEDALVAFTMTGKADFASLANSIIADLVRIQIRQSITGPLSGGITSMIGKLFGGGASTAAAAPGIDYGGGAGVVGYGASYAEGTDFVPQTGMALLHRGEAVIPAAQNKGGSPIVVQIINKTDTAVKGSQAGPAQFDGEKYIVGVMLEAMQNNPAVRNSMAGAMR